MHLRVAVPDFLGASAHEDAPTWGNTIYLERDSCVEAGSVEFCARRRTKHDVVIHDRVVHRQYHEVVGEVHGNPSETSTSQPQVTIRLVQRSRVA